MTVNFPISLAFLMISFAYSVALAILFFSKRRVKTMENKIFGIILIINIIGIILESSCIFFHLWFPKNEILNIFLYKLFLSTLIVDIIFFSLYVVNMVELSDGLSVKTKRKIEKIMKTIVLIVGISFIIGVFVLDLSIYDDGRVFYSYGPAIGLAFVISVLNVIWCSIYLFLTTKYSAANRRRNIPIIVFLIGLFICDIIQIKYPYITLANSIITFIDFLIYYSIENPMFNELTIAKNVATEANSAKKDFLSSMSHEMRTPLNAIVGLSQLFTKADDLDEVHKDATELFVASQNLLNIINGILDANSISANEIEIENKDYNIISELKNIEQITNVMIMNKNLKIESYYSKDLPVTLNGDIHKVKRIITNLLTNAIKYTNEGIINFNVNCINKGDTSTLIIEVKDTGRGMSEEQIEKLFNQFYRLEEDKDSDISGVGLGLAITKSFIDIMNGKIEVQSTLGEGTTFRIEIPQKIVDDKLEKIEEL